ncbi:MAG: molybdopterin molybdotransferase MoeA [Campylobacterales bacterium]|nr:molybdopterin molybdotransferase MoeA [Campylobacterales bacterium]
MVQGFWQKRIDVGFISFEESLEILDTITIEQKETIELNIVDAFGFVLAQDIMATENAPAFPTSAMDGYAFKYADGIKKLKITGINPAGGENKLEVTNGNCIKTFTGSLMPKESDTLIPIENVRVVDDEIEIISPVRQGSNVRAIGENYAKNELLIQKGTRIDFPQIGVMASLNITQIKVYKKPIIGVFATGSELLDVGEEQTLASQIRSSNHVTVEAIIKKYGGTSLQFGCVKDDKKSITKTLISALEKSDIVVTTGGVSVGDYDFVKDVVKELGFEVLFHGVMIKPGQHIMLAQKEDQFILALPGFAYSATVTALLYLLPFIGKFTSQKMQLKEINAILQEPFCKKSNTKSEFTACNVEIIDGKYFCNFKDKKEGSSAILTNLLAPSSALLYTNPHESPKDSGELVRVLLFD